MPSTDWVILSACNTPAGDATFAEELPGLARALFYAHRRKGRFAADITMARAEAMRQSGRSAIFTRKQGRQNRSRRTSQPWHNHHPFDLPFLEGG